MTTPSPGSGMQRHHFVGTGLGEVEHFLRQNYSEASLHRSADEPGFRFEHDSLAVPGFTISHLSSTPTFDAEVAPTPDAHIIVDSVCSGRLTWYSRYDGEVQSTAGDAVLSPPRAGFHIGVEPVETDVVTLDPARVLDYAAHACGLAGAPPEFTAITPLSPDLARHWHGTVAHVRDDILGDPALAAAPIAVDTGFRLLAAALLTAFPNTALDAVTDPHAPDVTGDVDDVSEATLREVVDYLNAFAGEPIGPAEIADVADVPYREVVEGLRRRHDTDPADLLWRARLRGAHRDLHDTDPAGARTPREAVAAIAARWGFTHVGTFAVAYTAAFGETPERTLGR